MFLCLSFVSIIQTHHHSSFRILKPGNMKRDLFGEVYHLEVRRFYKKTQHLLKCTTRNYSKMKLSLFFEQSYRTVRIPEAGKDLVLDQQLEKPVIFTVPAMASLRKMI